MRRRGEDDPDSLELMLDTICNMFGVIIVAALIAAVIVMPRIGGEARQARRIAHADRASLVGLPEAGRVRRPLMPGSPGRECRAPGAEPRARRRHRTG